MSVDPKTGFRKDDDSKVRYDLIDPWALHALAEVYTYGAKKYAPRNMDKGTAWSRYFGAAMRHMWAWQRGEDIDPESGLPHLAHAAWSMFTLFRYVHDGIGTDDRPGRELVQQLVAWFEQKRAKPGKWTISRTRVEAPNPAPRKDKKR